MIHHITIGSSIMPYLIITLHFCHSGIINKSGKVVITVTLTVDETLSCVNGGIYVVTGKCLGQCSGQNYPLWCKRERTFSQSTSINKSVALVMV